MTAHRVLLVGGQAEFVERKVVPRLQSLVAPDGAPVRVPRHVAWKTDRFPTDYVRVDAIMAVTDMVSHTLANAARDHARRLNVPYVPISRKWLESAATLVRYGYRVPPPEASSPPAAAPVEAAPTTPANPEVPVSRTYTPREKTLRKVVEALAAAPDATNAMLTNKCGDGARPHLANVRKQMGIVSPRGNALHRTVSIVPVAFVATCAEYGVSDEVACASLARFPHVEEAAPAPAPVPVAAPTPAPRPVPPSPMETLLDAVALLRAAMAEANVVSLSIDREGNVHAERMTITTLRL